MPETIHREVSIYWCVADPASDAVQRIADAAPPEGGDYAAIREAVGCRAGDLVSLDGPGLPGSLGDLLDRA